MEQNPFQLEFTNEEPAELEKLLKETVLGREGKLQYRHRDPVSRLRQFPQKIFYTLRIRDRMVMTITFVERFTTMGEKQIKSFYLRYLSAHRSVKVAKRKSKDSRKNQRKDSSLKLKTRAFANDYMKSYIEKTDGKAVFYAYIERANVNSYGVADLMDYESIRQIETHLFSRFFPSRDAAVSSIMESEKEEVTKQLQISYADHSFFSDEALFDSGEYFVLKVNDKIVAGIRTHKVVWDIVSLPGLKGFVFQRLLPYLPPFSRLFKPGELHFLAFDAVWLEPGQEAALSRLMSDICSRYKCYIGMMWFDKQCPIAHKTIAANKMGMINHLKFGMGAEIVCQFFNLSAEDIKAFHEKPSFVSALDII